MEVQIVFKGTITSRGVFVPERPLLYKARIDELKQKKVALTLEPDIPPKTTAQLAYFYGGIIRNSCVGSFDFDGWSADEIEKYIIASVCSYKKTMWANGQEIVVHMIDEIRKYNKVQMSKFIEDVIRFLAVNHGIEVLPSEEMKLNKYEKKEK
jgi:hypothetical protein